MSPFYCNIIYIIYQSLMIMSVVGEIQYNWTVNSEHKMLLLGGVSLSIKLRIGLILN